VKNSKVKNVPSRFSGIRLSLTVPAKSSKRQLIAADIKTMTVLSSGDNVGKVLLHIENMVTTLTHKVVMLVTSVIVT